MATGVQEQVPTVAWGNDGWSIGYVPATRGIVFFHEGRSVMTVALDEFMGRLADAGAPIFGRQGGRA